MKLSRSQYQKWVITREILELYAGETWTLSELLQDKRFARHRIERRLLLRILPALGVQQVERNGVAPYEYVVPETLPSEPKLNYRPFIDVMKGGKKMRLKRFNQ